jgi:hypothetical protein
MTYDTTDEILVQAIQENEITLVVPVQWYTVRRGSKPVIHFLSLSLSRYSVMYCTTLSSTYSELLEQKSLSLSLSQNAPI